MTKQRLRQINREWRRRWYETPRISRLGLSLQKAHLLHGSRRNEDAQVVRAHVGWLHEETVALAPVVERRPQQRLAVAKRDGDLASLDCRAEFGVVDASPIASKIAHEE